MKPALAQQVLAGVRQKRMFAAGDRVAVAVSGGADSVALLLLLEELRAELGVTLLVAHFHHGLRGAEADADADFAAALAAERGFEFLSERAEVAAEARRHGWNLEDAARRLRYGFFESLVSAGRATRVAVAHTADDQAETVLAHLFRGTGLAGLGGIYPQAGAVVRPLLEVRRAELRAYLAARGQGWREDSSNQDPARLRNRIRQQLLPVLEREFQPAIVAHLAALAARARDDQAFWAALAEDRFRALVVRDPQGLAVAAGDLLAPLPLLPALVGAALRRPIPLPQGRRKVAPTTEADTSANEALGARLVRRILAEVKGDLRGFTAGHVRQVLHLAAESASGRRIELPGVVVAREFDRLVFSAARRGRSKPAEAATAGVAYEYAVELPARGETAVSIPEIGRRIRLKVIDCPPAASDTSLLTDVLDCDQLRPPLVLRNWRPGDAYRPHGRRRVHKLKRLFVDGRVPARDRAGWPILTSAGELAWVRGMPVAAGFAAGRGTKTAVAIAEEVL